MIRNRHLGRRAAAFLSLALFALAVPGAPLAAKPPAGPEPAGGAPPAPAPVDARPFSLARSVGDVAVVQLNAAQWTFATVRTGPLVLGGVPLAEGRTVDLELERFHIVEPGTRFVLGRPGGPDVPLDFNPESVALFRGTVRGYPSSHVFLSIAPGSTTARIDLGPGEGRFLMSHRGGPDVELRSGELAVFPARSGPGRLLEVPLCGVTHHHAGPRPDRPAATGPDAFAPDDQRGVAPMRGLKRLRLAIETDYDYFELFEDADAAATYIVQLYGIVSDIYIRDVSTRVVLSYVRLWDTPDDLFSGPENPLVDFRNHWNQNMQSVPRDAAQFFSGRRNLSAGGVAYLSQLCTNAAYSWAGYAKGFFADPSVPDWTHRDIMVTAHELGHNCGTLHTHDYDLDACQTGQGAATRGSIMSYCGQGYSGGDANHDLWFHEVTAAEMRSYMNSRPNCIVFDCNANGIRDSLDIQSGFSQDVNGNGIPDECEDCNGNGVLDTIDIATGFSLDVNGNGIPDECEADCNGNGIPDVWEIQLGMVPDLNGNRIPDGCEADCDGDGVSDHVQIMADMSLDIDRNAVLDTCQRCTSGPGGPTDFEALDHAWNVYVGTMHGPGVAEFFGGSGVRMRTGAPNQIADTQDLVITPDRRVLISSFMQNRIAVMSPAGVHLGTLVPGGSGGLSGPAGMLLTPHGTLLVASRNTNSVLEFNATSGAFVRTLVAPGAGGLSLPYGLAFGPNGNLFVSSRSNQVFEFSGATGAFVRILVTAAANGGLDDPRGLLFKPDGNLLVCSRLGGNVLEYNGQTGAFLGRWNRNGTATVLTLDNPWCIRRGPSGDIYVSRSHSHRSDDGGGPGPGGLHQTDARVYRFDIRNGNFLRTYILGEDSGLDGPTGFDFMPGDATDCNFNYYPDWCDISEGRSRDINLNGRPDECDCLADWTSDGLVNSGDITAFLTTWLASVGGADQNGDFNNDGLVNSADITAFLSAWLDALTHGC